MNVAATEPNAPAPEDIATEDERPERGYNCRACGNTDQGTSVPAGWFVLNRAVGNRERHLRLGLYCTLPCLISSHRRLQQGHTAHAHQLDLNEDEFAQHAATIKRALQLMQDNGLSIRDTGDILGVPTGVLRKWLQAANICIDDSDQIPAAVPQQRQAAPRTLAYFIDQRPGHPPISTLHELEQAGYVRSLRWPSQASGPAHQPTFTTTATAIVTDSDQTVTASAQGITKTAAKTAAAKALLDRLRNATEPATV